MAVSDYAVNGQFGMGSLSRARQAGFSDDDIFRFLNSFGGTIGDKVRGEIASYNAAQEAAGTNTALGMGSFQRALASGQTPEQFFDYARNSGLTIGGGLQAEMDKFAASQQTLKQQAFEKDSLRGALKILGSQGERQIGKNTLAKLAKQYGTTENNIIKQLDIVNKNQGTKLGIGTNATLGLAEQAKGGFFNLASMGSGKVATKTQQYINAINAPTQRRTLGGGSTLVYGKVSPSIQEKQTAAGLIPLQGSKYAIDSKGNYVPRVSNKPSSSLQINSYTPPEFTEATTTGATNPVDNPPGPVEQTVSEEPSKYGPGGAGSALDGNATGLRSRRSRWRMANRTTKGTANFKVTGQNRRSSGINIR